MTFSYIPYINIGPKAKIVKENKFKIFFIINFLLFVSIGLFYLIDKEKCYNFLVDIFEGFLNLLGHISNFFIFIFYKISEGFVHLIKKIDGTHKKTVTHNHYHDHGGLFTKKQNHVHTHTHEFGGKSHGHKAKEMDFDDYDEYNTQEPTTEDEYKKSLKNEKNDFIETMTKFKKFVNSDKYHLIVAAAQIIIAFAFDEPKENIKLLLLIYYFLYIFANLAIN